MTTKATKQDLHDQKVWLLAELEAFEDRQLLKFFSLLCANIAKTANVQEVLGKLAETENLDPDSNIWALGFIKQLRDKLDQGSTNVQK